MVQKVRIPVSILLLVDRLKKLGLFEDQVQLAIAQAQKSHRFHKASGGGDFLTHHLYPVVYAVLENISEVEPANRSETVTVAFLHDVVEDDPSVTLHQLGQDFSKKVVKGVDYLTRQPGYDNASDEEKLKLSKAYMRRLMNAPRHVRLVKLADRAVNLDLNLSIAATDRPSRVKRIITETETLFLPLARGTLASFVELYEKYLEKLKLIDKNKA